MFFVLNLLLWKSDWSDPKLKHRHLDFKEILWFYLFWRLLDRFREKIDSGSSKKKNCGRKLPLFLSPIISLNIISTCLIIPSSISYNRCEGSHTYTTPKNLQFFKNFTDWFFFCWGSQKYYCKMKNMNVQSDLYTKWAPQRGGQKQVFEINNQICSAQKVFPFIPNFSIILPCQILNVLQYLFKYVQPPKNYSILLFFFPCGGLVFSSWLLLVVQKMKNQL